MNYCGIGSMPKIAWHSHQRNLYWQFSFHFYSFCFCKIFYASAFIYRANKSCIVLGKENLSDAKIPIHELGHFFNLPHTHHEDHYSMLVQELADGSECSPKGDFICDTPPDPDAGIYAAMVNYTDREMYGVYDENGVAYKPMINNFMGYYNACYMTPFLFAEGQYGVMRRFIGSGKRVGYLN